MPIFFVSFHRWRAKSVGSSAIALAHGEQYYIFFFVFNKFIVLFSICRLASAFCVWPLFLCVCRSLDTLVAVVAAVHSALFELHNLNYCNSTHIQQIIFVCVCECLLWFLLFTLNSKTVQCWSCLAECTLHCAHTNTPAVLHALFVSLVFGYHVIYVCVCVCCERKHRKRSEKINRERECGGV